MPHSEICGSKVAHTSPQLIAACHVLHRLCMPRHPPDTLTSRLRSPHHQRQRCPRAKGNVPLSHTRHQLQKSNQRLCRFMSLNPFTMSKNRDHPEGWVPNRCLLSWTSFMRGSWTLALPFRYRDAPAERPRINRTVREGIGGACRARTDDLKLAKLPLSQLS